MLLFKPLTHYLNHLIIFLITLAPNPTTSTTRNDAQVEVPMAIDEAVPTTALSNMTLNSSAKQQQPLSDALMAKMAPQALINIFHREYMREKQKEESSSSESSDDERSDDESSDDESSDNDESLDDADDESSDDSDNKSLDDSDDESSDDESSSDDSLDGTKKQDPPNEKMKEDSSDESDNEDFDAYLEKLRQNKSKKQDPPDHEIGKNKVPSEKSDTDKLPSLGSEEKNDDMDDLPPLADGSNEELADGSDEEKSDGDMDDLPPLADESDEEKSNGDDMDDLPSLAYGSDEEKDIPKDIPTIQESISNISSICNQDSELQELADQAANPTQKLVDMFNKSGAGGKGKRNFKQHTEPPSRPEIIKNKRSLDSFDDTASFKTAKDYVTSSPSKKAIEDETRRQEEYLAEVQLQRLAAKEEEEAKRKAAAEVELQRLAEEEEEEAKRKAAAEVELQRLAEEEKAKRQASAEEESKRLAEEGSIASRAKQRRGKAAVKIPITPNKTQPKRKYKKA